MNKALALITATLIGATVVAFAGLLLTDAPEWVMIVTRFYFSLKG